MAEAPVAASAKTQDRRREARARPDARGNGEHTARLGELRCECGQPNCRGTVPAVAETHRGTAEHFIVTPAHLNGGVVARAADRFFVVEPARSVLPQPRRGLA